MDVTKWFLAHARVTRSSVAELTDLEIADINLEADDLGLGRRLGLKQLLDLLEALEDEEDEAPEEDDEEDDDPEDEDEEGEADETA